MTRRLIIQPLAEADTTQAALWYADQRTGLGLEFLAEVDQSLERAVVTPRQFSCLRRKPEVRRVLTNRFPYRIIFVLRPDAIVVFRVLHSARHDQEWRKHVPKD